MTETMGQIIKRLRKERNLTQEELAEQLNITAPAVSKWENDAGMPDISQVVPLCNLFGVPTDVLFGVYGTDHDEDVKQRLAEIFRIYDNCPDGEEGPTAILILDKYREAMRLYPNHSKILLNAAAFAGMVLEYNVKELTELIGEEGVEELSRDRIRWSELIIRYSTDADDVLSAKRNLLEIFAESGNLQEAEELIKSFPGKVSDVRSIRKADLYYSFGMRKEQREEHCRNVKELAEALGHQAIMLGNLYMNEGQYEEALYCYTFMHRFLDAIYREETYRPPFVYDGYSLYHFPACCLVKLGRNEEAVDMLEKGVGFILAQAAQYNRTKTLDIPLMKDCRFEYGIEGKADYPHTAGKLRELIGGDELKPLWDNPRYRALAKQAESVTEG